MEILIDSEIRNWVFIPIILLMLFFTLIRINIQRLTATAPSMPSIKTKDALE